MSSPPKDKQLPTCLSDRADKTSETKQYTEYFFAASTTAVRRLLIEELLDRVERSVAKSDASDKYELASWDRYQADQVGYRRALREIIKLLDR